jgi:TIR domain
MTDIFFSYSSRDRERVLLLRNALVDIGFAVFWDQEVPAGTDWDSWIRRHLQESKCAVVVWSSHSIASDNVRHEATIAKQQNKLVPAMLDVLGADQFPMGLYTVQAANLTGWAGNRDDQEWLKLLNQIETKLTPAWVRRSLDALEAELIAERARREASERRDRTFRDQLVTEAQARQELQAEVDGARDQIADLTARLEAASESRTGDRLRADDVAVRLRESERDRDALVAERERANARIAELERGIAELETSRRELIARLESAESRAGTAEARIVELTDAMRRAEGQVAELDHAAAAHAVSAALPGSSHVGTAEYRGRRAAAEDVPQTQPVAAISDPPSELTQAATSGDRPCPHCGQPIRRLARLCGYCWRKVTA